MTNIQKDIMTMNKVYLLDKQILPIFGFKSVRDYKYVLYYDKMKDEIVEQINNKLDGVFKLLNKKRFSLHKTNGKILTLNGTFNFLKMYLEDVCIPFKIFNTKHKGVVSKCMRLIPFNKIVYNYIMEAEIPTPHKTENKQLLKDVVYEHDGWQVIIFSKETQEKYKNSQFNYILPCDYSIYFYHPTYFQNFKEDGREIMYAWRNGIYVGLSTVGRFGYGQLNKTSENNITLLESLREHNIIEQTKLVELGNDDYWEHEELIIKAFEKGNKVGDKCLFFGEKTDDVTYPCFYEYFVGLVYHHKDHGVMFPTLKSGAITKMTDTQRFELNAYNVGKLDSAANQSARIAYMPKENITWLVQDKIVKIKFPELIMKPSIDEISDTRCMCCHCIRDPDEFFWEPNNYVRLAFKNSMRQYKIKVLDMHLGKCKFDLRLVLNVEKRKTFD